MPHDDSSLSTAHADMPVVDRRVLDRIFQHPMTHNLSWRDAFALFRSIGAVEHAHNGDVVLRLGGDRLRLVPAHGKDLAADDVMALRHFLTQSGWSPRTAPSQGPAAQPSDLMIVIDHAGARIYSVTPKAGDPVREVHHLHHHSLRREQDADRAEEYPADRAFFDAIADALAGPGQIVVIGHGTGQSNEADHLMTDLATHHADIHARVAGQLAADLSHITVPELAALARDVLHPPRIDAA